MKISYQFQRDEETAAKEVARETISIIEKMMEPMQIKGETEAQLLRDRMVFLDYCASSINSAITKKKNELLRSRKRK